MLEPNPQGTSQIARPFGEIFIDAGSTTPLAREVEAGDDFTGTDEHGTGKTIGPARHIHTSVHAIAQVDIEQTGRAEHHRITFGSAAAGMRGRVVPRPGRIAAICLYFDDADRHSTRPQHRTEKAVRRGHRFHGQFLNAHPRNCRRRADNDCHATHSNQERIIEFGIGRPGRRSCMSAMPTIVQ